MLIIDVGAGQLVEPTFRSFLESCGAYPSRTVVIDCGEQSFRERHGENAPNEVHRYYGAGSLEPCWQQAKRASCCVDSSGSVAPEHWAEQLRSILEALPTDPV